MRKLLKLPPNGNARDRFILWVTLSYALFSLAWIFLSDRVLTSFSNLDALVWMSTAKGVFFVLATSIGLFVILRIVPGRDRVEGETLFHELGAGFVPRRQHQVAAYFLAVTLALAATVLRNLLENTYGDDFLILLLFPVVLSSLLGGIGPGLLATITVAAGRILQAHDALTSRSPEPGNDTFDVAILVAMGLLVSLLSEVFRRMQKGNENDHRLLEAVISGTSDAVFAKDLGGRYLLANTAAAQFIGQPVGAVLGRDDTQLFPAATASALKEIDHLVMVSGKTQTQEEIVTTLQGDTLTFDVTKGPLFDNEQRVIGLFGVSRDISARKHDEAKLRDSELFGRAILDSVDAEIAVLDHEGNIVSVNQQWLQFAEDNAAESGLPSPSTAVGSNYLQYCEQVRFSIGSDNLGLKEGIQQVISGELATIRLEYPCDSPQQKRWFQMSVTPLETAERGAVITHIDISERKRAENQLRTSEERLRLIASATSDGIWDWDLRTGIVFRSTTYYDIVERRPEEDVEHSLTFFKSLVDPTDWPHVYELIQAHVENRTKLIEFDFQLVDQGGKVKWLATRGQAVERDAEGRALRIVGNLSNITERKKTDIALSNSEHVLKEAQRLAQLGNWELNILTGEIVWSREMYAIFGRDPKLPPANVAESAQYYTPESWSRASAVFEQAMADGSPYEIDAELVHADGSHHWMVARGNAILDVSGKAVKLYGTVQDITARKKIEEQLRKLAQAVEQSPESIVITDLDARIEYVNAAFTRNSGYSAKDVIGKNSRLLQSGATPLINYASMWEALSEGRNWEGEFHNRRKDGSDYIEHAVISPIRREDGKVTHYLAVKENVTAKKQTEAEMQRLLYYDPLTKLPNHKLLMEHLSLSVAGARRSGKFSALMLFNIDRFKTINDAGGAPLGDSLLQLLSARLMHNLRNADFVARMVGDEFGIMFADLSLIQTEAANLVLHIAEKIHGSMIEPFQLDQQTITLTASLGVALFPESAEDSAMDIQRRASTALHHAKTAGGGQTAFFESSLDEAAKQLFNIERELHQAIAGRELRLYLQSQVNAAGKSVGAEALVRWQHPQRGLQPPGTFIPIAEKSNLIVELDTWVLTQVCQLLARENTLIAPNRISVNISPRHFHQDSFVHQIKQVLATTGADPARLMLEVTEGMLIDNINEVIAKMNDLHAIGVHFSLDDFGTGYSSLAYLKRLPIQELKIDKTFVQDITADSNDASLVETILAIAQHLHLQVVAEGVETAEQAAFLNQRGQVIHQGYFFAKPEPLEFWLDRLRAEQ